MVLETIDTINRGDAALLPAPSPAKEAFHPSDALSPLSAATQPSFPKSASSRSASSSLKSASREGRDEAPAGANAGTPRSVAAADSRDAGVAAPCDSIRSYANELTAVSASLSSDKGQKQPPAEEDAREGPPPTPPPPPAEEAPAAPAADAAPAAVEPEAPTPAPVMVTRVVSHTPPPPVEKMTIDGIPAAELNRTSSTPPRVTLITVTDSDECKLDASGGRNVNRTRSEESFEVMDVIAAPSIEVLDVPAAPEDMVEPEEEEPAEETKPETVAEETEPEPEAEVKPEPEPEAEPETKPEEAKPEESDPAAETKEEEAAKPTEEAAKPEAAEAAEPTEEAAKPEAPEEVEASANKSEESPGKRKKFGLKKLSKPNLSKPNLLPKKPTSPRSSLRISKPRFSKPALGRKLRRNGSGSPATTEEAAKEEGDKEQAKEEAKEEAADAAPAETAEDSPAKEEGAKEEEPAAKEAEAPAAAEAEEPKEDEMETIDLKEDKPAAEAPPASPAAVEAAPSIPGVEEKASCSAFIVQKNSTRAEEELRRSAEEGADDASAGEVPVKGQVTEVVTKPVAEGGAAAEEHEDGVLDAESKTKTGEEKADIIEMLYQKAESCFGDVTNMCGPKQKGAKGSSARSMKKFGLGKKSKSKEEDSAAATGTDLEELDGADKELKADKSMEVVTVVPTQSEADKKETEDQEDAKKAASAEKDEAAAYTPPVLTTIDGTPPPAESTPMEELLTPLSIATEQAVDTVSSFLDAVKENDSFKSIVESLSQGAESVSKIANDALFPQEAEGEAKAVDEKAAAAKAEQEKLDRAAEMAKKALDSPTNEADQQEKPKGKSGKPPTGKRFGFGRRAARKEKAKPQLKVSPPKEDEGDDAAAAEAKPKSPTSPTLGDRLKFGFGKKEAKEGKSKSKTKSSDAKKVGLRMFRKTGKKSSAKKSAAVEKEESSIRSDDVKGDLASEGPNDVSIANSQSLNEPQPSRDSKEERSEATEDAATDAAVVPEVAAAPAAPVSEEAPASPVEDLAKAASKPKPEEAAPAPASPEKEEAAAPVSEEPATTEEPKADEVPAVRSKKSEEAPTEKAEEPKAEAPSS